MWTFTALFLEHFPYNSEWQILWNTVQLNWTPKRTLFSSSCEKCNTCIYTRLTYFFILNGLVHRLESGIWDIDCAHGSMPPCVQCPPLYTRALPTELCRKVWRQALPRLDKKNKNKELNWGSNEHTDVVLSWEFIISLLITFLPWISTGYEH